MKSAARFAIVLVTAPDVKVARGLAEPLLKEKLAACVNIVPKLESHYWWEGKLEVATEALLIIKTSQSKLAALERFILGRHPYDTPEFLVLPLSSGSERYLQWLRASML